MQDRYLPRVWTDEGYYYPVFSELGITYENPKFGSKYEEIKNLDWVYAWILGENDLEFKYKLEMPTSLKDKNGKLIYEGDIVDIKEHIDRVNGLYEVIYDDINHCWALKRNEEYLYNYSYLTFSDLNGFADDCEIIGNIHENPDLLENKDE